MRVFIRGPCYGYKVPTQLLSGFYIVTTRFTPLLAARSDPTRTLTIDTQPMNDITIILLL
jgi:hypothetical protein